MAVMGIEQINFMWYLKKISWLGLIGFAAGILVFHCKCKLDSDLNANKIMKSINEN